MSDKVVYFARNTSLGESGGNQPLSAENSGKSPTQTLAEATDGKTELIRELTRAKVAFQLRAIKAVLGELG